MKPAFRRDGATWFLYLSLAVFGFQQSVLGSTLPFLRKELHFDTVDVGWHFTFYAVGLVASGALSGRLLGRLRVDALVRLGTVLMVAAVLCITQATGPYGTIACATAMGLTGGILQAGMCLGNFFPLIISNAIRLAPHRVGLISVGATQAVGVALLVVPIVLGYVGQTIGLVNAIGMLAVLPLLMAAAYLLAARRRAAAQRVAGGAGTR